MQEQDRRPPPGPVAGSGSSFADRTSQDAEIAACSASRHFVGEAGFRPERHTVALAISPPSRAFRWFPKNKATTPMDSAMNVVRWACNSVFILLPSLFLYNSGLAAGLFFVTALSFSVGLIVFADARQAIGENSGLVGLLTALVLFGVLSAFWSVAPTKSISASLNFALLVAAVPFLLSRTGRHVLDQLAFQSVLVGFGLALSLMAIEIVSGNSILAHVSGAGWKPQFDAVSEFNRGHALLVLMAWPVAAWSWIRGARLTALLACTCAGGIAILGNSNATKTGFLLGATVLILAYLVGARQRNVLAGLLAALFWFGGAFLTGTLHDVEHHLPDTAVSAAAGRVEYWDHLDRLAWQRPILGWGAGTSGRLPPTSEAEGYSREFTGRTVTYAHNLPLEMRVDLGIVGLLLLGGVLGIAVRGLRQLTASLAPFGLACFASTLWIVSLGFRTWSDTTIVLYILPTLLFVLAHRSLDDRRQG